MREWLSGGASPCQGEGRGFDPRLALLFMPINRTLKQSESGSLWVTRDTKLHIKDKNCVDPLKINQEILWMFDKSSSVIL